MVVISWLVKSDRVQGASHQHESYSVNCTSSSGTLLQPEKLLLRTDYTNLAYILDAKSICSVYS